MTSAAGMLIGSASDFDTLILYPERARKRSSPTYKIGRVIWGWVSVRMMSSAKREILNSLPLTDMPRISGLFQIEAARGSTQNVNNRGESGDPCLVPFATEKDVESAKGVLT